MSKPKSSRLQNITNLRSFFFLILGMLVVWVFYVYVQPFFNSANIEFEKFIFSIVGGLGMFLFGMHLMSSGMQKIAGRRLKIILQTLTKNRFMGILLGGLATMVIQSSSIATVMTVGFVNAGLMELKQAISLILGMNIGTTVTVQIIAFEIDRYALPIIGLGAAFFLFSKRDKGKSLGESLFGVGALFFGFHLMKEALVPFHDDVSLKLFFSSLGDNVLLAVLAGAIVTMIIQSSAAVVGLIMQLVASGIISLEAAVLIVLGSNIGTTLTANLAAIGGSANAKRAARAHFIFNTVGVLLILTVLPFFTEFVRFVTPDYAGSLREIANMHSLFNVITVIVFLPFIPLLTKISGWFVKKDVGELSYLEDTALENVSVALDQVNIALSDMSKLVVRSFENARKCLFNHRPDWDLVFELENRIDHYQDVIIDYMGKITHKDIPEEEASRVPTLMYLTNDLEKIGDFTDKLAKIALEIREEGEKFSLAEKKELNKYFSEVFVLLKKMSSLLRHQKNVSTRDILQTCEALNLFYGNLRRRNRKRYQKKKNISMANHYFDIIGALDDVVVRVRDVARIILSRVV